MEWNLEYGELAMDADFVDKCENLKDNLTEIQTILERLLPLKNQFDKMSLTAQVDLDLLLAFILNSLYWANLRIKGVDVSSHPIKRELDRIKAAMVKWQQFKDLEHRPKVNVAVAKRFVRNGLYDHKHNGDNPPNKKTRFEDGSE